MKKNLTIALIVVIFICLWLGVQTFIESLTVSFGAIIFAYICLLTVAFIHAEKHKILFRIIGILGFTTLAILCYWKYGRVVVHFFYLVLVSPFIIILGLTVKEKYFKISAILGIASVILIARCFNNMIIFTSILAAVIVPILILIYDKHKYKFDDKKIIKYILNGMCVIISFVLNGVFVIVACAYLTSTPSTPKIDEDITKYKLKEVTEIEENNLVKANSIKEYNEWQDFIINNDVDVSKNLYIISFFNPIEINIPESFNGEMKSLIADKKYEEFMDKYKKNMKLVDKIYNLKNGSTLSYYYSVVRYQDIINTYIENYYDIHEEDRKLIEDKIDDLIKSYPDKWEHAMDDCINSWLLMANQYKEQYNWPLYDHNRYLKFMAELRKLYLDYLLTSKINSKLGVELENERVRADYFASDLIEAQIDRLQRMQKPILSLKTQKNVIAYLKGKNKADVQKPINEFTGSEIIILENEKEITFESCEYKDDQILDLRELVVRKK